MKKSRRFITLLLIAVTLFLPLSGFASYSAELELDCQSAILMEAETGAVLFEKNADQALPPASVTKIMTLLLIMEAVDSGKISLDDMVQVSDKASTMGGSQIYLKAGETMKAEDLLKSIVIASANDAALAMAEYISGSEEAFVELMNKRAAELGMANTHFENTNGLDDDTVNHVTSARDIAIMSRELITAHKKILEYSSIWMDTVRDGAFGLTNTNRLIRFYNGANGLKTGSTAKAKFCISATAKRDGMQLIAVIMAAPTRDIRNDAAKKLLDYGFAGYSYVLWESQMLENLPVVGGKSETCPIMHGEFKIVLPKGSEARAEKKIELPETLYAPINAGDVVGSVEYTVDGQTVGKCDIVASESVEKIGYFGLLGKLIKKLLLV